MTSSDFIKCLVLPPYRVPLFFILVSLLSYAPMLTSHILSIIQSLHKSVLKKNSLKKQHINKIIKKDCADNIDSKLHRARETD